MRLAPVFIRQGRETRVLYEDGSLSAAFRGFIQPLRYKNKMYLFGVNTAIGFDSEGRYLYIGPPGYDLTALPGGACLLCGGVKYRVERAEKVYKGSEPFYIWAIVRVVVEEEP